jgi:hypothetical protein
MSFRRDLADHHAVDPELEVPANASPDSLRTMRAPHRPDTRPGNDDGLTIAPLGHQEPMVA